MSERLKKLKRRDALIAGMSEDTLTRVVAINNTNTINEAQKRFNLDYLSVQILGRAMLASSILSSLLKGEERVIMEIHASGPVQMVYAESLQVGEVRGYITRNPDIDMPLQQYTQLTIPQALQQGAMVVRKVLYDHATPVLSSVELKGDICSDLIHYFKQSEQIPSALHMDVIVDPQTNQALASYAIFVQALPGTPLQHIEDIQNNLDQLYNIPTEELVNARDDGEIISKILQFAPKLADAIQKKTLLDFHCRCAPKDFMGSLQSLGEQELKSMQHDGHNALVCQFCNKTHTLSDADFDKLIAGAKADAMQQKGTSQ